MLVIFGILLSPGEKGNILTHLVCQIALSCPQTPKHLTVHSTNVPAADGSKLNTCFEQQKHMFLPFLSLIIHH